MLLKKKNSIKLFKNFLALKAKKKNYEIVSSIVFSFWALFPVDSITEKNFEYKKKKFIPHILLLTLFKIFFSSLFSKFYSKLNNNFPVTPFFSPVLKDFLDTRSYYIVSTFMFYLSQTANLFSLKVKLFFSRFYKKGLKNLFSLFNLDFSKNHLLFYFLFHYEKELANSLCLDKKGVISFLEFVTYSLYLFKFYFNAEKYNNLKVTKGFSELKICYILALENLNNLEILKQFIIKLKFILIDIFFLKPCFTLNNSLLSKGHFNINNQVNELFNSFFKLNSRNVLSLNFSTNLVSSTEDSLSFSSKTVSRKKQKVSRKRVPFSALKKLKIKRKLKFQIEKPRGFYFRFKLNLFIFRLYKGSLVNKEFDFFSLVKKFKIKNIIFIYFQIFFNFWKRKSRVFSNFSKSVFFFSLGTFNLVLGSDFAYKKVMSSNFYTYNFNLLKSFFFYYNKMNRKILTLKLITKWNNFFLLVTDSHGNILLKDSTAALIKRREALQKKRKKKVVKRFKRSTYMAQVLLNVSFRRIIKRIHTGNKFWKKLGQGTKNPTIPFNIEMSTFAAKKSQKLLSFFSRNWNTSINSFSIIQPLSFSNKGTRKIKNRKGRRYPKNKFLLK